MLPIKLAKFSSYGSSEICAATSPFATPFITLPPIAVVLGKDFDRFFTPSDIFFIP